MELEKLQEKITQDRYMYVNASVIFLARYNALHNNYVKDVFFMHTLHTCNEV